MALDFLVPQTPINPNADRYGQRALDLSRSAYEEVACHFDIPYGPDPAQKLDVLRPKDPSLRDLPVLLFFHGGGWTHGYKEWCGFMAPAVAAYPAILVAADYRLIPAAMFPAAVEDGFQALHWIETRIAAFGGDPARIGVGGHSAGGHIAALMTMRADLRASASVDARAIKACFPISATFSTRMVSAAVAPDLAPLEPTSAPRPDSPLALVANASVPFYIVWGDAERAAVQETGTAMVQALQAAGQSVVADVWPDHDHFETHLATATAGHTWHRRVSAWLNGDIGH